MARRLALRKLSSRHDEVSNRLPSWQKLYSAKTEQLGDVGVSVVLGRIHHVVELSAGVTAERIFGIDPNRNNPTVVLFVTDENAVLGHAFPRRFKSENCGHRIEQTPRKRIVAPNHCLIILR